MVLSVGGYNRKKKEAVEEIAGTRNIGKERDHS